MHPTWGGYKLQRTALSRVRYPAKPGVEVRLLRHSLVVSFLYFTLKTNHFIILSMYLVVVTLLR